MKWQRWQRWMSCPRMAEGTGWAEVIAWNAQTYERVFSRREESSHRNILGVDFSPDSTRLVSAWTASIWDIATRQRVQTLDHGDWVSAVKYSPQGDRIATATPDSVRIYDSNDGRLLVDIPGKVTPWFNTGLLWFDNDLFVVSDRKIKRIEASTGSAVSEWPVPDNIHFSCIALPKHGEFIAYSTRRTVTFWDTATHIQLGFIQHPQDIYSIAVSPDDRLLAIGGEDGKITINSLSRVTVSILSRYNFSRMPVKPGRSAINCCADIPVACSISEIISGDSLWFGNSRSRRSHTTW